MSKPNDITRLRHILDAARTAVQFTRGISRSGFLKNKMLELALIRLLEVIGEAAGGITSEMKNAYPEIAWRNMASMRNRLIHGYFDVDQALVWETVTVELPPLILQLEDIVKKEGK